METGTLIVLAVLIVAAIYLVGMYNKLVADRNRFKNAYAQIDVQLQRRYDLIPNLVETAKGYLAHERETLEAVIQARNRAQGAARDAASRPEEGQRIGALGAAEGILGSALGRFFALAEAYPDLKANQTMRDLMEELSATENKVSFSRQHFNDAVTSYNNRREQFPDNVVAAMFNFAPAELLTVHDPGVREAPKVSF